MRKNKIKLRVVYKIKNKSTGKMYIGSAENYWNRIWKHKSDLRTNIHHNHYLQNAWNKYGEEDFEFSIIENLEIGDNIVEREQYWIDYLNIKDKNIGYNLKLRAYSNLGYKFSEQSKIKMSISKKNKKWTEKQREVLGNLKRSERKHCRGKNNVLSKSINQYDINDNFIQNWESINICSIKLNLHKSNIVMCLKGKIKQTRGFIFKYEK
jgi:group I intron endonuclease